MLWIPVFYILAHWLPGLSHVCGWAWLNVCASSLCSSSWLSFPFLWSTFGSTSDSSGRSRFILVIFFLLWYFFLRPGVRIESWAVCSGRDLGFFLNDGQDACSVHSAGSTSCWTVTTAPGNSTIFASFHGFSCLLRILFPCFIQWLYLWCGWYAAWNPSAFKSSLKEAKSQFWSESQFRDSLGGTSGFELSLKVQLWDDVSFPLLNVWVSWLRCLCSYWIKSFFRESSSP